MGGIVGPAALKFSLAAGALSFPATVDMHPARVVLDPGVAMTSVSEDYARRLHLAHVGHATTRAGSATIAGDTTGPVTVRMGGAFFRVPSLLIATLGDLSRIAGGADMVIGADTLDRTTLAIDFEHDRINAVAEGDLRGATRGFRPVALEKGAAGERRMTVRIGDDPPVPAIVDFASPNPVLMNRAAMATGGLEAIEPRSTGLMATPSGPQATITFSLPALTVEGNRLRDVPAQAAATWAAPAPVILGLEVFEQFRLVLDLRHDRLWLKPGPPRPFDRDLTGLTVEKQGNALRIVHIAQGSPAALSGVRSGTTITAIDGKAIDDGYFASDAWRWRFGAAGTRIVLTIDGADVPLTTARFD